MVRLSVRGVAPPLSSSGLSTGVAQTAPPGLNQKSLGKPTEVTTEATAGLNQKSLGKPTEVTTEATPGRNREAVEIVQSGLLTNADRDYGQHNICPDKVANNPVRMTRASVILAY